MRLAAWHRVKGSFHRGKTVEATAERKVGLGLLCVVGLHRYPAVLRLREISWSPSEQTNEEFPLHVPFSAVVTGYDDEWRELILSKKAAEPGPFERFTSLHPVGSVVEGTVERRVPGGFVLSLEGRVEGFLPANCVPAPTRRAMALVEGAEDLLVGDVVKAVVTEVQKDDRRRILVDVKAFLVMQDRTAALLVREKRAQGDPRPAIVATQGNSQTMGGSRTEASARVPLTVFLLEDREGILSPVLWALTSRGHRVKTAASLHDAEQTLARVETVDVGLIDLQLDGQSIRPFCASLRKRYPRMRMFAFSGNPDAVTLESQEFGALFDGVILKPVQLDALLSYVEQRSTPPSFNRALSLDQAIKSFIMDRKAAKGSEPAMSRNDIIDGYLDDVQEVLPGARVAVLSYSPETNEISCVRAKGLPEEYMNRLRNVLPFTPIGDVVIEGRPQSQRLNAMSESSNTYMRDLMGPIHAYVYAGFPLRIEARHEPLGIVVFGPEDADTISQWQIKAIENAANALALAIERSLIDIELVMHQRAMCAGSLMLGMTHEIRNLVQGMQGYQFQLDRLIGESDEVPSQDRRALAQNAVDRMHEQTDSLSGCLESFLGIVKLETSGSCRLDEMLWQVVDMCRSAASQYDIVLTVDIPSDMKMPAVPTIVRQAILNLVINAIQHTAAARDENGMVRIAVIGSESNGRGLANVFVSDNGWGMHAVHRAKAFEMFFTTRRNGSGLGLYVTKLITESVGGEVSIEESVRYAGTTFRLRVPAL